MAEKVTRILFLAANPKGTSQLRLDEEAKQIRKGLERSQQREQFLIETRWAVDASELRRALLDVEPHIVHFSGHGVGRKGSDVERAGTRATKVASRPSSGAEGLVLQDTNGKPKLASSRALANLFELFEGQIECVLLNACYSETQAEAIYQHVNHVVGMSRAIGDQVAIDFAVGFYDALGAGRSYDMAYRFGCSAIDFTDIKQSLTPVLKARIQPDCPNLMGKADDAVAKVLGAENPGSKNSASQNPDPESHGGQVLDGANPDPESFAGSEAEQTSVSSGEDKSDVTSPVMLENPEGQVPLNSPFYAERPPIESDAYSAIVKPGALIRVKAARQMGKTSLMSRILDHGSQQGYRAVPVYFQEADGEIFSDLDAFLQWFCGIVAEELDLPDSVEEFWQRGRLGSKRKCTNFFQKCILPGINKPLVLGLDEVDLVFQHLTIAQDFFALLRTWHERDKNQPIWQNLRLVIVHSREVYIPLDMHQSPFNVGVSIELAEFQTAQLTWLAVRHGLKLTDTEIADLMAMLGGHPYLSRVALYEIARGRRTLVEFLRVAPTEEGPFDDHLRRHLGNVRSDPDLVKAIEAIIDSQAPVVIGTDEAFQLRSMGLIKLKKNAAMPLCDLYRRYFKERLKDAL